MSIRISDLPEENDPQREDVFPVVSDAAGATRKLSLGTLGLEFGFGLRELVVFESSGTFEKADYPWLRAVRVRLVGGGGGGGGVGITSSTEQAIGQGGSGACYAESFLGEELLDAQIPVTVGLGGAGGDPGDNNGADGEVSSFGALVSAVGGLGGVGMSGAPLISSGGGRSGGSSGVGDIVVAGGSSGARFLVIVDGFGRGRGGAGGDCLLGFGGEERGSSGTGLPGVGYGAGGSAGVNRNGESSPRGGGDGADGVVIVELYG